MAVEAAVESLEECYCAPRARAIWISQYHIHDMARDRYTDVGCKNFLQQVEVEFAACAQAKTACRVAVVSIPIVVVLIVVVLRGSTL